MTIYELRITSRYQTQLPRTMYFTTLKAAERERNTVAKFKGNLVIQVISPIHVIEGDDNLPEAEVVG